MHSYIHRYIHTYIHIHINTCIHTYIHPCMNASRHTCIPVHKIVSCLHCKKNSIFSNADFFFFCRELMLNDATLDEHKKAIASLLIERGAHWPFPDVWKCCFSYLPFFFEEYVVILFWLQYTNLHCDAFVHEIYHWRFLFMLPMHLLITFHWWLKCDVFLSSSFAYVCEREQGGGGRRWYNSKSRDGKLVCCRCQS